MKWMVCRVLAVVLCAVVVPDRLSAQGREAYGVVTSIQFLDNGGHGPSRDRLQELKSGSVRIGIDWAVVQPQPNGPFEWGFVDAMLNSARSVGMEIYANLGEPPLWAAACAQCMPYNSSEWYNYVRAVVERYQAFYGSAITFGVWNEPNDKKFLRTSPGDDHGWQSPFNYYILAYWALQARTDLGNGARFAVGDMTAPAVTNESWWFEQFWNLISPYMHPQDLIATHWYPNDGSVHNLLMQIYVRTGREIWITETGPQTPTTDAAQVNIINYLFDEFQSPGRYIFWTRFFYYRLWDGQLDREALLFPSWVPRPGFNTYKDRVPGNPPQGGGDDPTFYEHLDFTGASFARGSDWDFVEDWNDRITSVRVPAGVTVILYQHWHFEGESLTLTSDAADLRDFPFPGGGTWNDQVSSIRIIR